jgi:hypothetical protein
MKRGFLYILGYFQYLLINQRDEAALVLLMNILGKRKCNPFSRRDIAAECEPLFKPAQNAETQSVCARGRAANLTNANGSLSGTANANNNTITSPSVDTLAVM